MSSGNPAKRLSVHERIRGVSVLIEQQNTARDASADASNRVIQLDRELNEVRSSIQMRIEHIEHRGLITDRDDVMIALRARESTLGRDLRDAKITLERTRTEAADLAQRLQVARSSASLDEVEEHQSSIRAARARISKLREAISLEERNLEGISAEMPDIAAAAEQIHLLSARVVLGEASQEELTTAEEAAERVDAAADEKGLKEDQHIRALIGLNGMLSEAQKALADLEVQTPEIIYQFLRGRAEAIGSAYAEAVANISALAAQLCALDRLAYRTRRERRNWLQESLFAVPTFRLESCKEVQPLLGNRLADSDIARALEKELDPLRSLGVKLL